MRAFLFASFVVLVMLVSGCGGRAGPLTAEQARVDAVKLLHQEDAESSLLVGGATKAFDPKSGRDAWEVWFHAASGFGSGYSGCQVYVWRGGGRVGPHCTGWRN